MHLIDEVRARCSTEVETPKQRRVLEVPMHGMLRLSLSGDHSSVGPAAQPRFGQCASGNGKSVDAALERSQKIDNSLLVVGTQLIEILDDLICFAATALVSSDGFDQVVGPPVMEKENTLSDAP